MIKHADSHLDHGLTDAQVAYILERFAGRSAFFIETFELPEELGTVPCGLYGPAMGDSPVTAVSDSLAHVSCAEPAIGGLSVGRAVALHYKQRGTREYTSRCIDAPWRQVRTVTVIAGPHEETCPICHGEKGFGAFHARIPCTSCWVGADASGPARSTGKRKLPCVLYTAFGGPATPQEPGDPGCKDIEASKRFWAEHALAVSPS